MLAPGLIAGIIDGNPMGGHNGSNTAVLVLGLLLFMVETLLGVVICVYRYTKSKSARKEARRFALIFGLIIAVGFGVYLNNRNYLRGEIINTDGREDY